LRNAPLPSRELAHDECDAKDAHSKPDADGGVPDRL
jgi:hypothetical protein